MNTLPHQFSWLADIGAPMMVVEAVKLYGVVEAPGAADNPIILGWAKETGLDKAGYNDDEIPWCGLFMAVVAKRARKTVPVLALRALSWKSFGLESPEPSLGDVLVKERKNANGDVIGGHVTLYVAENATHYFGLGGNQSDAVTVAPIAKASVVACRRPIYVVKPTNVKPVLVGTDVAGDPGNGKEV